MRDFMYLLMVFYIERQPLSIIVDIAGIVRISVIIIVTRNRILILAY